MSPRLVCPLPRPPFLTSVVRNCRIAVAPFLVPLRMFRYQAMQLRHFLPLRSCWIGWSRHPQASRPLVPLVVTAMFMVLMTYPGRIRLPSRSITLSSTAGLQYRELIPLFSILHNNSSLPVHIMRQLCCPINSNYFSGSSSSQDTSRTRWIPR